MELPDADLSDRTSADYRPPLRAGVDAGEVGLDTLWDVRDELLACVEALEAEAENPDRLTPDDLVGFFADHGCGDAMVPWTDAQIATSREEGKIPTLENWRGALATGEVALDSLMSLAGLNSFLVDQKAMDERVENVLSKR